MWLLFFDWVKNISMLQEGRIDYYVPIFVELSLYWEICLELFCFFVGLFDGKFPYFFHSLLVEPLYLNFLWLRRIYITYMWRKTLRSVSLIVMSSLALIFLCFLCLFNILWTFLCEILILRRKWCLFLLLFIIRYLSIDFLDSLSPWPNLVFKVICFVFTYIPFKIEKLIGICFYFCCR